MGLSKEDQRNKYRLSGEVSFVSPIINKKSYKRTSYKVRNKPKDNKPIPNNKTQILCLTTVLKQGHFKGELISNIIKTQFGRNYILRLIKQSNRFAYDITLLDLLI